MNSSDDHEDDISYDVSHSSSLERSVGRKGSFSDEDDSKDPSYKAPAESDDDGLFYSDDDILDAEFERGLDEVARAIEYSDPKRINHGRHRTTLIAGGPAQPDYIGMAAREKDNAKAEYEVKLSSIFCLWHKIPTWNIMFFALISCNLNLNIKVLRGCNCLDLLQ